MSMYTYKTFYLVNIVLIEVCKLNTQFVNLITTLCVLVCMCKTYTSYTYTLHTEHT